jgi:hypothetical protein
LEDRDPFPAENYGELTAKDTARIVRWWQGKLQRNRLGDRWQPAPPYQGMSTIARAAIMASHNRPVRDPYATARSQQHWAEHRAKVALEAAAKAAGPVISDAPPIVPDVETTPVAAMAEAA